jgi:hypothetical protein
MLPSDLTIEVRNANLERVGQILPVDLVKFQAVLRLRNVGSWAITLPNDHHLVDDLRATGAGIVVTGPSGVVLSGPMTNATYTANAEHPDGDWVIQGVDDSVILGERLAYPQPSNSDVTTQDTEFDTQSGAAETVIYHYVDANIGPSASVARQIPELTLGTDLGRGNTVTVSARFDRIGELIGPIAEESGLGFDVVQNGGVLEFSVFVPTDRSAYVRMDIDNNQLTQTEYVYSAPVTTRAIVAGQGEGVNRTLIEATSTESLASETAWGRRVERFIDSRNGATVAALNQAGAEELAVNGTTLTKVSVTPTDDTTMQYGVDWNLGDKVSVVVADQTVSTTITEVGLQMSKEGVVVTATVGEPTGFSFEAKISQKQVNTENRVSALERTVNTSSLGSERQVAYVKNATGSSMAKGTVVYPTGSTGANKLVAKSQANAESTSSKTFGVLDEAIANGGHGYAVTFGMVENIDTSALTEGAAVYLSPTVAGGMTSTKPSAPNHMVLVGFCIRSHAVTGRLFVKIQNGFELDELHDVSITSVAGGEVIVRNAGNTLWINQTLAEAGISATSHNHSLDSLSNVTITANANGEILKWNGTAWVNNTLAEANVSAVGHTHAIADVTSLSSSLSGKEPSITAGTTAQYWRGDKSWQTLDKTAVGLANVDNTTDANKPISTATQTALNAKFDRPVLIGSTSVDLNNYTTDGLWHQASNAWAGGGSGGVNYPVANAGMLRVWEDSAYIYQEYQTYSTTNRRFFRGRYNSVWSTWKEIAVQDGVSVPFRIAAGSYLGGTALAANAQATITMTLPTGKFTVAPIVTALSTSPRYVLAIGTVTTTSVPLTVRNVSDATGTNYDVYFQAIQMTSGAAAG